MKEIESESEDLPTGIFVGIKGLRKTHFQQLLAYAAARESDGWTYGNPAHFKKRHSELVDWIDGVLEMMEG